MSTKYANIITMSDKTDKDRLIDLTSTYEMLRGQAVLDKLGGLAINPVVELDLGSPEGINALLDSVRDDPASKAKDEFDVQTRQRFKPIGSFYLHSIEVGFIELDTTKNLHAARGKAASHVALTGKVLRDELVLERVRHVGGDHQQMIVTEKDWQTFHAALDELSQLNDALSSPE